LTAPGAVERGRDIGEDEVEVVQVPREVISRVLRRIINIH
jgi:hypothetical protein